MKPDDDRWREHARSLRTPPPTPREQIWDGIVGRLEEARRTEQAPVVPLGPRRARHVPWRTVGLAASVALLAGLTIGRLTAPDSAPTAGTSSPGVATASGSATSRANLTNPQAAVRLATLRHLGRAESLLALMQADARQGAPATSLGDVSSWSHGLLSETRLLMDSSGADTPELRALLEDLELILVQVALLGRDEMSRDGRQAEELKLIADGLERRELLARIQALLPAERVAETL